MRVALLLALSFGVALSGCGSVRESRLNPFNWFGRAEPAAVAVAETTDPAVAADGRQLVAQVTDLTVEPTRGGAIVRATGLPPTQGYWEAELVAREVDEDGVLIYDFRVFPPPGPRPASTPRSRQITAAAYLSDFKLGSISRITVQAAGNALSSRR